MPLVTARARCYPTEDPHKVEKVILNVFPDGIIEHSEDQIMVRSTSLDRFKQLIRNYRILDSTRKVLLHGVRSGSTGFVLNKQVAYVGKLSFVEEQAPLGGIEVTIEDEGIEALIDRVAPVTLDGVEVVA